MFEEEDDDKVFFFTQHRKSIKRVIPVQVAVIVVDMWMKQFPYELVFS